MGSYSLIPRLRGNDATGTRLTWADYILQDEDRRTVVNNYSILGSALVFVCDHCITLGAKDERTFEKDFLELP